MSHFLPVRHPASFLLPAALCVLRRSGGCKRSKNKNMNIHLSTLFDSQPFRTNILLLTITSIKSWPGVWVAGPGLTGTTLHHTCKQNKAWYHVCVCVYMWSKYLNAYVSYLTTCRGVKGYQGYKKKTVCLPKEVLQDGDTRLLKQEGWIKHISFCTFILLY